MKKLMIIMLMGIILLIPFNTHAYDNGYEYGLPIYQLDQKITELNNHTLRQVFEINLLQNDDISSTHNWIPYDVTNYEYYSGPDYISFQATSQYGGITNNSYTSVENNKYYVVVNAMSWTGTGQAYLFNGDIGIQFTRIDGVFETKTAIINSIYGVGEFKYIDLKDTGFAIQHIKQFSVYNMNDFGIISLTVEQMDYYFNLYQLALKYELDNKDAVKDPGQYKHIFMSIYEGLTNLMRSMGSVWRFLTTPFVDTTLSDMDNLFSIDWSWDIFDVLRQWITNMAVWILQLNAVLIGTLFLILGIPIKVSILSLVFSDLVFVILGWIMIKSFII